MDRQRAEAETMRQNLQHKHDRTLAKRTTVHAAVGAAYEVPVDGQVVFGSSFGSAEAAAPATQSEIRCADPQLGIPATPKRLTPSMKRHNSLIGARNYGGASKNGGTDSPKVVGARRGSLVVLTSMMVNRKEPLSWRGYMIIVRGFFASIGRILKELVRAPTPQNHVSLPYLYPTPLAHCLPGRRSPPSSSWHSVLLLGRARQKPSRETAALSPGRSSEDGSFSCLMSSTSCDAGNAVARWAHNIVILDSAKALQTVNTTHTSDACLSMLPAGSLRCLSSLFSSSQFDLCIAMLVITYVALRIPGKRSSADDTAEIVGNRLSNIDWATRESTLSSKVPNQKSPSWN